MRNLSKITLSISALTLALGLGACAKDTSQSGQSQSGSGDVAASCEAFLDNIDAHEKEIGEAPQSAAPQLLDGVDNPEVKEAAMGMIDAWQITADTDPEDSDALIDTSGIVLEATEIFQEVCNR